MSQIRIYDIDEDLHQELKVAAVRQNMTLNNYLKKYLKKLVRNEKK